jgi:hypothetical protein
MSSGARTALGSRIQSVTAGDTVHGFRNEWQVPSRFISTFCGTQLILCRSTDSVTPCVSTLSCDNVDVVVFG